MYQPVTTPAVAKPVVAKPVAVKPAEKKAVQAELILHVPADADVYLVDTKMKSTGTTRQFRIPLNDADKDYNYDIRVEVVRNGKTLVKEAKRTIRAGQKLEFTVAATGTDNDQALAMK